MKKPIDLKNLGQRNEQLIISLLRKHGPMSQAQLRKRANLSSSTASYIVSRLRTKQLITETQGQSSSRGRKPVLLTINPIGRHVIGIEINPNTTVVGLFDFTGKSIEEITTPLANNHSPQNVCNVIEITLRGLLAKHSIAPDSLAGIGVALSGSITSDGTVELSSPLGWKSVPLKEFLTQCLPAPVTICTTRVRLLAEMEIEPDASCDNVLYLNIADGVGSHVIIDGKLLHGSANRTGEIGHIIVDPNGPTCGCGHKGCLEALISGPAITKKIVSDLQQGTQTVLAHTLSPNDTPQQTIEKLADAANQNDPYALSIRAFITDHFARATAIAINFCDPEIIIIAGYLSTHFYPQLKAAIEKSFPTNVYDSEARNIKITPAKAPQNPLTKGAAITILQNTTAP